MANEKWDDPMLDAQFQRYDNELEALRALPAVVAAYDIRMGNLHDHLTSVARDIHELRSEHREENSNNAKLRTQIIVAVIGGVFLLLAAMLGVLPLLLHH